MRSVISASRRTDIPAFYLPWLLDGIRTDSVAIANPLNRAQTRSVSLRPKDVAWFVFWSRNYAVWLRNRDAFANYQCAFHFTITAGHEFVEPDVPKTEVAIAQAEALVKHYGPERFFWRYDPIVFWRDGDGLHTNHDESVFRRLCHELGAMGVKTCTISIATLYRKTVARMARAGVAPVDLSNDARLALGSSLRDIAGESGIELCACCSPDLLNIPGITQARCIDGGLLTRLGGERVSVASGSTREGCGCTKSIDIGDYEQQPCGYDCLYCYAHPSGRRFRDTEL